MKLREMVQSGTTEDYLKALDYALEVGAESSWPVVKTMFGHSSPEVREAVIQAAVKLDVDGLGAFLVEAVADLDANVGLTALHSAGKLQTTEQNAVYGAALRNGVEDVGITAVAELEVESTHTAVNTMLQGLSSKNQEVRLETRDTLEFLFDRPFTTNEEGVIWWEANRKNYDRDLIVKADFVE